MDEAKRQRRSVRQMLMRQAKSGLEARTGNKTAARNHVDCLLKKIRENQKRAAETPAPDFHYERA